MPALCDGVGRMRRAGSFREDRVTPPGGSQVSYGSRRGGTSSRLSIKQPTSLALFAELLHVWQSILHALGLSNALITTQFLQEVVFDAMSQLLFSWEQAYCLLLIYIEAIESHPLQFNLGNVFGAGSQDTRCKAAVWRPDQLDPAGMNQLSPVRPK